ncbi:MAG: hypothetical protein DRH57_04765 [Candidatus Cloacimonadota bacterium]|nr:MAG: hypothetical protein DRH57_04765 [Candidatus Cloacimonadota bacterium]
MSKYQEIDLSKIRTYSVKDRKSKVHLKDFIKMDQVNIIDFINVLPNFLKAKDFRKLLFYCVNAYKIRKPIMIMMGGHIIKLGLGPLLIKLMENKIITSIAVNGSVCIHDFEIALFGKTSEDVSQALEDGSFGMGEETGRIINQVINQGDEQNLGVGEALGKYIMENKLPNWKKSVFAQAYKNNVPITVHIAIGTDIIHQHKYADGGHTGRASYRDFKIFTNLVKELNNGGILMNFGSAVILPEIFLKAVTIVRNLGYPLKNFYTAVFDMNYHYRPQTNIVQRPTASGGKGYYFIGHHEIMIPLFGYALLNSINNFNW